MIRQYGHDIPVAERVRLKALIKGRPQQPQQQAAILRPNTSLAFKLSSHDSSWVSQPSSRVSLLYWLPRQVNAALHATPRPPTARTARASAGRMRMSSLSARPALSARTSTSTLPSRPSESARLTRKQVYSKAGGKRKTIRPSTAR